MQATTALTLTLPPLTPGAADQPLGLAAATALGLQVDDADAVLHRVLLPANVDNINSAYSTVNGYHFKNFPLLTRTDAAHTVRDWDDLPLSLATLRLIAIDVRPLYPLTDIRATGTLTSTNTNVTAGDTVSIDGKTYTFRPALTPAEGEVLRGATADLTLQNLIYAINHTGTPGTHYSCAAAHPSVSAAPAVTAAHQVLISSLLPGLAYNLIILAETAATLSWSAATLLGSSDPTARTLEGTVRIELKDNLLPYSATYSSSLDITLASPSLLTFAVPAGWTPNTVGSLKITFRDTYVIDPKLVNAACTLLLIGTRA